MGTRGTWGIYKDGVTKATYNHYDSYPSGLGVIIADFILDTSAAELNNIFDRIEMVSGEATEEQIKHCYEIGLKEQDVSTGQKEEWYALLRNTQGDMSYYKNGLRFMESGGVQFMQDSLFCEWAYIINLDTETLEVYEGYKKTSEKNRYYHEDVEKESYKNCHLLREIPFSDLSAKLIGSLE